MTTETEPATATVAYQLDLVSQEAYHTDCLWADKANLWRDETLFDAQKLHVAHQSSKPIICRLDRCDLLPAEQVALVQTIDRSRFVPRSCTAGPIVPREGRIYPKGFLRGIEGVFPENLEPFRCVAVNGERLLADLNHPLSAHHPMLTVTVHGLRTKDHEWGGSCVDWGEVLLTGPGIQARYRSRQTDFFSDDPFYREDQDQDIAFYARPRRTLHIDENASRHIGEVYARHLSPGMKVLDLMAGWRSHLTDEMALRSVVGLGMNELEMRENPALTNYIVHDLNRRPQLPFNDASFDAVVCTVSVEYMTRPFEVFEDVHRILRPGGSFVLTFSNRWFPPKVVRVWTELHDFERMGYVLELFLRTGLFEELGTYSMRGLPRPEDDRHYPAVKTSDPVYAVWGKKPA